MGDSGATKSASSYDSDNENVSKNHKEDNPRTCLRNATEEILDSSVWVVEVGLQSTNDFFTGETHVDHALYCLFVFTATNEGGCV